MNILTAIPALNKVVVFFSDVFIQNKKISNDEKNFNAEIKRIKRVLEFEAGANDELIAENKQLKDENLLLFHKNENAEKTIKLLARDNVRLTKRILVAAVLQLFVVVLFVAFICFVYLA